VDGWKERRLERTAGQAQLKATKDRVAELGYTVLSREGFEAGDMIASAIEAVSSWYSAHDCLQSAPTILVVGGLLLWQLVRELPLPAVRVVPPRMPRTPHTSADVETTLGIPPGRIRELVALAGDSSPDHTGLSGLGEVRARHVMATTTVSECLQLWGSCKEAPRLGNGTEGPLREGLASGRLGLLWDLAGFHVGHVDLAGLEPPRRCADAQPPAIESVEEAELEPEREPEAEQPLLSAAVAQDELDEDPPEEPASEREPEPVKQRAMMVRSDDASLWKLAQGAASSKLFPVRDPLAAFLLVKAGAELGLPPMASLRSIHLVEGKPVLSAQLMMSLCSQHADCEYFRVLEADHKHSVVEAKRRSWPSASRWEYTMADASSAQLTGKQNWRKYPRAMLTNRCIAEASRFWFPEAVHGCYLPEELEA
jgi:hypothetical protein